ncbi:MAG: hypothetical protein ACTSP3_11160 [Candidatus Heimdallarchaeaceae archaeon]
MKKEHIITLIISFLIIGGAIGALERLNLLLLLIILSKISMVLHLNYLIFETKQFFWIL